MHKAKAMIKQAAHRPFSGLRIIRAPDGAVVEFPDGKRRRVQVQRHNEHYVLTSVVLGTARVQAIGTNMLLPRVWQRNRATPVVGFRLDKRGRLVGSIYQLAETLDQSELEYYLERLARECSSFAYGLSGGGNPDAY